MKKTASPLTSVPKHIRNRIDQFRMAEPVIVRQGKDEITSLVMTALLTLASYSLTDTVVVFDRIRENLHKKGRQELKEVINLSINEVLSRTIITSGTVFLVLMALLLTGGVLLHDFALALLIGVVVGTYSSVFVASPIVYIWPTSGKKWREVLKSRNNRNEDIDGHR